MKEELLQYIWQHGLFEQECLKTHKGETIQIISRGQRNQDSGPDFFNARIRIGDTTWAGNVEVHINSSDWNKHKHSGNVAYDNVILHVVLKHDEEIRPSTQKMIPSLELVPIQGIIERYEELQDSRQNIACQNKLQSLKAFEVSVFISRLSIERLEDKTETIKQTYLECNKDWHQTFQQQLFTSFGLKANTLPFTMLSRTLPHNILSKHCDNLLQIEALLFGQAGFLEEDYIDGYHKVLRDEYLFLRKKYNLNPMDKSVWKFMRMRPANFPTIRISQLAKLMHKRNNLISHTLNAKFIKEVEHILDTSATPYWEKHYSFGKESEQKTKKLGSLTKRNILINTIIPFMFFYAKERSKPKIQEKALRFLEELPSEKNTIIEEWGRHGIKSKSAFDSQALIQLMNRYCKNRKCLQCQIGSKVLKHNYLQ
ncbi:MAG: DUF2851 family protein [Bacteroidales bacterium]